MADIILILVLLLFAWTGYKKGFARTLINASANIVSIIFSVIFANPVADIICKSQLGNFIRNVAVSTVADNVKNVKIPPEAVKVAADGICMTVSSVLSFIIIALIVKILLSLIAGAIDVVAKLPLLKQANRILGAATGAISGFLILYVIIGVLFALSDSKAIEISNIISSVENSQLCSLLLKNNIVRDTVSSVL